MRTKVDRLVDESTVDERGVEDGETGEGGVEGVDVEVQVDDDRRRLYRGANSVDSTADEVQVRRQCRRTTDDRFDTCECEVVHVRESEEVRKTETGDHRSDSVEQVEDLHDELSVDTCLFCEETTGDV